MHNFLCCFRYMLTIVDNEEFYEREKPLSLKDIRCLIVILRQVIVASHFYFPVKEDMYWLLISQLWKRIEHFINAFHMSNFSSKKGMEICQQCGEQVC